MGYYVASTERSNWIRAHRVQAEIRPRKQDWITAISDREKYSGMKGIGTKVCESVHRRRVIGKECSDSIPKWSRLFAILFCCRISMSSWIFEWVNWSRVVSLFFEDAVKMEVKKMKKARKTKEIKKSKGSRKIEKAKVMSPLSTASWYIYRTGLTSRTSSS